MFTRLVDELTLEGTRKMSQYLFSAAHNPFNHYGTNNDFYLKETIPGHDSSWSILLTRTLSIHSYLGQHAFVNLKHLQAILSSVHADHLTLSFWHLPETQHATNTMTPHHWLLFFSVCNQTSVLCSVTNNRFNCFPSFGRILGSVNSRKSPDKDFNMDSSDGEKQHGPGSRVTM